MTFLTPEKRLEGVRLGLLWSAALAMSFVVVGCATPNISKSVAPIADQPRADEATELRGWQKSVSLYETGTTQGWATRFYYMPDPDNQTVYNLFADSTMMIAQTITLPVTVLTVDHPFRKVYYEGDVLPASYTSMPPLSTERPYGPPNPDPDPLSMGRAPLLPPIPPVPVEHPALVIPRYETPTPMRPVVPAAKPKSTVTPPATPAKPAAPAKPTAPPTTRPAKWPSDPT